MNGNDEAANENNILSEDCVQLYDRQIRIWGGHAQRCIQNLKVLVIGATPIGTEVSKNLVLAGVKLLTILDEEKTTEYDIKNQYALKPSDIETNRALAVTLALKILNPNVKVSAECASIRSKSADFYSQFNVVLVTAEKIEDIYFVEKLCRENGITFIYSNIFGSFGFAVHNVNCSSLFDKYNYTATGRRSLVKNCCYILFKVLHDFMELHERKPNPLKYKEDNETLKDISNTVLKDLGHPPDYLPSYYLEIEFDEFGPTSTIIGAFIAQDILKCSYGEIENGVKFFDPFAIMGFCTTVDDFKD